MKVIHKHEVDVGSFALELPVGAEILDVQEQHGAPVLWALGDPDGPREDRYFVGHVTGHPEPHDVWERRRYVGTCQLRGGTYVLHLFEEIVG